MSNVKVSILFGTHQRFEYLKHCVSSIRRDVGTSALAWEIVVADGASTDGTRAWLAEQPDCRLVEGGLNGAVQAFNAAFAAADPKSDYYVLLNDDAELHGPAITTAIACLEQKTRAGVPGGEQVGQCAIPFRRLGEAAFRFDRYTLVPGIFANFGAIRGPLARGIARICGGLWPPCYRTYGGDCELSSWVYALGWKVLPLPLHLGVGIEDLMVSDTLREANTVDRRWQLDAHVFRSRWSRRQLRISEATWLSHTTIDKATLARFQELRHELAPPPV